MNIFFTATIIFNPTRRAQKMSKFCVNKEAQKTGEHEVHHIEKCTVKNLPAIKNRHELVGASTCKEAVTLAKKKFPIVDGCFHCCRSEHREPRR